MAWPPGCALNGSVPTNLPVPSRPRDGAMLGGVCAGLARRWRVDPALLRIAVVVLSLFSGLGLLAYATGMLLMPREDAGEPPVRRLLPFTRRWSTGAVVAVTIGVAIGLAGIVASQGIGLGPVLLIFGIWFFGFRGRGAANGRNPAAPPEPTPYERAAEHWRQRLVEQQAPGYAGTLLPETAEQRWEQPYTNPAKDLAVSDHDLPVVVPAPLRPRRWALWWLALALVGAGIVTVTLLGAAGLPATPLAYAAAVLAGLGATLLAATRRGRPALLLPATLIAALVTGNLLFTTAGLTLPSVGEKQYRFATGTELPPRLDLSAGELAVDLRGLTLADDQALELRLGAGQLTLQVPRDVTTEVVWLVKAGEVSASGGPVSEGQAGLDLAGSTFYPAEVEGAPVLRVTASVDLGELAVTR